MTSEEVPDGMVPVDGGHMYKVGETAVKDLSDKDLARIAAELASATPHLLTNHTAALRALVFNEQLLGVVTHELNRRRRSIITN